MELEALQHLEGVDELFGKPDASDIASAEDSVGLVSRNVVVLDLDEGD